jgi:cytochrome c5
MEKTKGVDMKLTITGTLIAATLFSTIAVASETPEQLFDAKCSACHSKTKPADMSKAGVSFS